jgi:hypothetical protein
MRFFVSVHFQGFLFFILIDFACLFFVKTFPKNNIITGVYPHCV